MLKLRFGESSFTLMIQMETPGHFRNYHHGANLRYRNQKNLSRALRLEF
jgi:hypothetical protein